MRRALASCAAAASCAGLMLFMDIRRTMGAPPGVPVGEAVGVPPRLPPGDAAGDTDSRRALGPSSTLAAASATKGSFSSTPCGDVTNTASSSLSRGDGTPAAAFTTFHAAEVDFPVACPSTVTFLRWISEPFATDVYWCSNDFMPSSVPPSDSILLYATWRLRRLMTVPICAAHPG